MTPEEAIEILGDFEKQAKAKVDGAYQTNVGKMACDMAIEAIKEVQRYREIGTVEECREAVEKQKPERPIKDKWKHDCCPSCGWFVSEETGWGDRYNPHCENCGQAIQWDENLEGREDEL